MTAHGRVEILSLRRRSLARFHGSGSHLDQRTLELSIGTQKGYLLSLIRNRIHMQCDEDKAGKLAVRDWFFEVQRGERSH